MTTLRQSLPHSTTTVEIRTKPLGWLPVLAAALGAVLLSMDFIVNVSDSAAPPGVYRVLWGQPIHRGDLILRREPLNRVAARPGDTVRFAPDGVYVNGKRLDRSAVPKRS